MDLEVVKTDAGPRADGAAQHRRRLQPRATRPGEQGCAATSRARDPITGAKKWEVEIPRAAAREPAVHRRQPAVRAGRARHAARLRRHATARSCGATTTARATTAASSATRPRASSTSRSMTGWGGLVGDDYGAFFGQAVQHLPEGFRRAGGVPLAPEPELHAKWRGEWTVVVHFPLNFCFLKMRRTLESCIQRLTSARNIRIFPQSPR